MKYPSGRIMGDRPNAPTAVEELLDEACRIYRAQVPRAWDAPVAAAFAEQDGRVAVTTDPGCMASLARTVAVLADYFDGEWAAGDVAITNDVFAGNALATEFTAIAPGPAGGWCAVRAEVPDIGGWSLGGRAPQALDTWSEGARIAPVKLSTTQGLRREVRQIVMLNSRTPRLNDACMRAFHASISHLTASPAPGAPEGGPPPTPVRDLLRPLSGREFRAAVPMPLPFGDETAVAFETEIRLRGDRLTVSFPNAPPLSPLPVNATRWITADAVNRAIAACFALDSRSATALAAWIEIEVADGGLLAARWPATVGFGRAVAGRAVFLAVLEALAPVARPAGFNTWRPDRGIHPGDRFVDWESLSLAAGRRRVIAAIESEIEQ